MLIYLLYFRYSILWIHHVVSWILIRSGTLRFVAVSLSNHALPQLFLFDFLDEFLVTAAKDLQQPVLLVRLILR